MLDGLDQHLYEIKFYTKYHNKKKKPNCNTLINMNEKNLMQKIEFIKTRMEQIDGVSVRNWRRFGKPINSKEIKEFEEKYHCTLPLGYKLFLEHIGNGGQTYYQSHLIKLENSIRDPLSQAEIPVNNLAKEFLFTKEVNKSDENFFQKNFWERYQGMIYLDYDTQPSTTILIVNGPEAGNMWKYFAYIDELSPYQSKSGASRVNFLNWFLDSMDWYLDNIVPRRKKYCK